MAVCALKASSRRRLGFLGVILCVLSSNRLWVDNGTVGDDDSCRAGSTGGKGKLVWTI